MKDNGRAAVIGDAHTYGKGKIQSVFELSDGSALFVTVARYKTPVRGATLALCDIICAQSIFLPMVYQMTSRLLHLNVGGPSRAPWLAPCSHLSMCPSRLLIALIQPFLVGVLVASNTLEI